MTPGSVQNLPPAGPSSADGHRVEALDRARGLGMLAIVIGHVYFPGTGSVDLQTLLYAFHVPLFFFLSGTFFTPLSWSEGRVLARRLQRIVVPYLIWAVISLGTFLAVGAVATDALGRGAQQGGVGRYVWGVIQANPTGGDMDWNRPLWFLNALAVTYVAAFLILAALRPFGVAGVLVALALSLLGSAWVDGRLVEWPWSAERALMLFPFFVAGHLARQAVFRVRDVRGIQGFGVAVVSLVVLGCAWLIAARNGLVEYIMLVYGDSWAVFLLAAILGIVGTVGLASAVPIRWLATVGRDSLAVLVMHKFFVVAIQVVLIRLSIDQNVPSWVLVVAGGILATVLCTWVRPLVQMVWPMAVGRQTRA